MNLIRKKWRWFLSGWIGFVFVQSLFFTIAGAPEPRFIFGTVGRWAEMSWFVNYGAYFIGIVELVASLLLFSRWRVWGALLALLIMSAAIFFHLFTPLGLQIPVFDEKGMATSATDGGLLFIIACATWVCALVLIVKDGGHRQVGGHRSG